ncbi:hypothetical protein K505DRAFT_367527 [Melanomma pulvis-pyrius CBS 109.77]|uniref:Uncharacterized protein n=1 Tax=Melanomma pulvis-pyrius CBS 109.77 TaxID=1314802 RepID=A0A6A6WTI7_9PLEO|nr:hypothetical protein K505DRAFT_367527 [Melanomma pulvis-pyrius CBS 109.77]
MTRPGSNVSRMMSDSPWTVSLEMAIISAAAMWLIANTLSRFRSDSISGIFVFLLAAIWLRRRRGKIVHL